ncbi:hypothetical protein PE067_16050 [Paracoccus sp. DMF-8]|uniref:hypothetical protein n=1 Tax=Paracoccus sp. DMF-8 TaxID=3019445 RepID=UPI0023E3D993|nr:hypothetical protein [Paracoccus sp. DMF-8]MDF3607520.1 hypothetical protein [Paracoccus sp. DMF-8]
MTLTLDTARAIVRQPGLHLSSVVDDAIDRMMRSPDWTDQNEATALQRAIRREGRPVSHEEAHDFRNGNMDALHWPSVLVWGAMAIGVFAAWAYALPLAIHGLRAVARFVWGL